MLVDDELRQGSLRFKKPNSEEFLSSSKKTIPLLTDLSMLSPEEAMLRDDQIQEVKNLMRVLKPQEKYVMKMKPAITDGSAVITGVLLAFNLPSNLPVWIIVIGALVAMGIGKLVFGGLGKNIFNPALVGRVFLLISFPAQMTTWPEPGFFPMQYTDATTGATTLNMLQNHFGTIPDYSSLLLGKMGGSMGEVGAIAILLGFLFLLWKKIIQWYIPVFTVLTVFMFTGVMHWINPVEYGSPLIHILSGGLLLGAVFMATDYVTSPMTQKGMIIYAIGIGIITSVIRLWGIYPEGVSFAILIMNAVTPLLNVYVKPKRYGGEKV